MKSTHLNFDINNAPANLRPAFFPVSLQPLYWELGLETEREASLWSESNTTSHQSWGEWALQENNDHIHNDNRYRLCPRHVAVARLDEPFVYQCATTDNYDLFTNADAIMAADFIARHMFKVPSLALLPDSTATLYGEMESKCTMDFSDNDLEFNVIDNDTWSPFLRIRNSYTRGTKIYYTFGFKMRFFEGTESHDLCVTFNDVCASINEDHKPGVFARISHKIENDLLKHNMPDIDYVKSYFKNIMIALEARSIKRVDILPIALRLFEIKKVENEEDLNKCQRLYFAIQNGMRHFMNEPDSFNAYNLFRVLAYVVSNPLEFLARMVLDGFDENFKFQSELGSMASQIYDAVCCKGQTLRELIGEQYYKLAESILEKIK